MTTNYCPKCPADMNGSRRTLLLDGGTKCHGCGYTLRTVNLAKLDAITLYFVKCAAADHGMLTPPEKEHLALRVHRALLADLQENDNLDLDCWDCKNISIMTEGPSGEDLDADAYWEGLSDNWPNLQQVLAEALG
jgi:hypothetical protein